VIVARTARDAPARCLQSAREIRLAVVEGIEKQMSRETDGLPKLDNVILSEIQVLLAEKRAALASLRIRATNLPA
jgi:hypothetical protein